MASRQEKEERAEAEAYYINDANREREHEERPKIATDRSQQEERRPGDIGSVLKAVADTLGHAKEAVVGKGQEDAETNGRNGEKARDDRESAEDGTKDYNYTTVKAEETTDAAGGKMEEAKEAAKEKEEETKEATKIKLDEYADKARETKDAAKEKVSEYTDHAAEKARETVDKVGEYKDSAEEKAKGKKESTEEYVSEKAEDTKKKVGEYKEFAAEKAKEAKDSVFEKADEYTDYSAEKAAETKDYPAETAEGERDSALSKVGELQESAKDAARKAMDLFVGKKGEGEEKGTVTVQATKGKLSETEEEARGKMEELRLRDEEDRKARKREAEK